MAWLAAGPKLGGLKAILAEAAPIPTTDLLMSASPEDVVFNDFASPLSWDPKLKPKPRKFMPMV
jgi:hypothetical protein